MNNLHKIWYKNEKCYINFSPFLQRSLQKNFRFMGIYYLERLYLRCKFGHNFKHCLACRWRLKKLHMATDIWWPKFGNLQNADIVDIYPTTWWYVWEISQRVMCSLNKRLVWRLKGMTLKLRRLILYDKLSVNSKCNEWKISLISKCNE